MKKLIHYWLLQPTDNTLIQLFRSLFVGGLATVADMGVLYALHDALGWNLYLSTALAFIAGVTVNYLLSTIWVFHKRQLRNRTLEIAVFVLLGLVGLGLNELLMWGLSHRLGLHYMLTKIIATFVVYFWNFFARKLILYR